MSEPPLDRPDGSDESVGAALARWRKQRKMSGHALGKLVGLSQATVSRLENGVSSLDPQDVRRIAEALELPAAEIDRLVANAEHPSDQLVDWQATEPDLPARQQFVRQLETLGREVRTFQPAVVVGLLQTSEYARALLTPVETELAEDQLAASALAVSEAVSARMQRSQALYDRSRRFIFIMAETVLRNRVCAPVDMIGQIARLREVAELPNVSVRIIPEDARWPTAPYHGFEIMGEKSVLVDLFNTSLFSRGRRTVRNYRRVFDAYEALGTADIDPILDRHQKRYIRMLPGTAA